MRTYKDIFKEEGFTVLEEDASNKLLKFIKENHPAIIRDNEVSLEELKVALGLPIDEKVNGYGLNFIGRNVARSKYASKTEKELKVNQELSKDFDTTQNVVLKGDNLDSLKLLKSHYSGKVKCIYIDPPYNTTNDNFVYPDKFDKEEAEVLGLANLSQDDMDRLEFSFSTKKSHNGWLSFMYPRLLLARDLLRDDGAIFISIDHNEQANLKLLCDEIFGEDNFISDIIWNSRKSVSNDAIISLNHNYTLVYSKNSSAFINIKSEFKLSTSPEGFANPDNDPKGIWKADPFDSPGIRPNLTYKIKNPNTGKEYMPPKGRCWRTGPMEFQEFLAQGRIVFGRNGTSGPQLKRYYSDAKDKGRTTKSIWDNVGTATNGTKEIQEIFGSKIFDTPKPTTFIKQIIDLATKGENSLILDFFAGSGTTGHAVMLLNAEDGGNRKFILCQIDEPIADDKPAYQFCIDNNLEPVISSITIERLRRAGEKIKAEVEDENSENDLFRENKKQVPDIGFKVFDTVDAPKLALEEGKIAFQNTDNDTLSRIYNMIFSIGIDSPTATLECVVDDCVYKIENHYYITNSEEVSNEELSKAIKNGKVFIDGWTASLNATLQHYKEDVKIVF